MKSQKKGIIVLTGLKLNRLTREFNQSQYVTYLNIGNKRYKMNAAAGVLRQIRSDYVVIGTCYSDSDRELISKLGWIEKDKLFNINLLDSTGVSMLVDAVENLKSELKLPVHVVHYGGASDTSTELPNNSLMAHTWDMRDDALKDLVANNCITLINLIQALKTNSVFENQRESKIIIVSAAAAVRAKQRLGLDTIQKGAGHSLARTLALDLTPENIYITEIMPGSTDTGFFDNDFTMETAIDVSKNMGYNYTAETYPVFTAEQIGDAVKYTLDANCNVREIVLLPYGQFPHLGA